MWGLLYDHHFGGHAHVGVVLQVLLGGQAFDGGDGISIKTRRWGGSFSGCGHGKGIAVLRVKEVGGRLLAVEATRGTRDGGGGHWGQSGKVG